MNRFKMIFLVPLSIILIGAVNVADAADTQKLIGNWRRPDGGYVIDIRKIKKNGELDAAYYNPKQVNMSRALFMRKNGVLKIFIELRDQGYPGSTYTLNYDSKDDVLAGEYFHAGMNQIYKVMFLRKKQ